MISIGSETLKEGFELCRGVLKLNVEARPFISFNINRSRIQHEIVSDSLGFSRVAVTDNSGIFEIGMTEMDDDILIRLATVEDWETIADFNCRLALETEGKQLDSDTISAGVRTLLTDTRHGRYFIACQQGRIVGQMMHTKEWSDWRNGEIWWLQSVYVHPACRRAGVFRKLYARLEELAESTPGVVGIRLYVEQQNAKAMEAYRSLGLVNAHYAVMERIFSKP